MLRCADVSGNMAKADEARCRDQSLGPSLLRSFRTSCCFQAEIKPVSYTDCWSYSKVGMFEGCSRVVHLDRGEGVKSLFGIFLDSYFQLLQAYNLILQLDGPDACSDKLPHRPIVAYWQFLGRVSLKTRKVHCLDSTTRTFSTVNNAACKNDKGCFSCINLSPYQRKLVSSQKQEEQIPRAFSSQLTRVYSLDTTLELISFSVF